MTTAERLTKVRLLNPCSYGKRDECLNQGRASEKCDGCKEQDELDALARDFAALEADSIKITLPDLTDTESFRRWKAEHHEPIKRERDEAVRLLRDARTWISPYAVLDGSKSTASRLIDKIDKLLEGK